MFLKLTKTVNKIGIKITLLYSTLLLLSLIASFFTVYSFFEIYLDDKIKQEITEKAKSYKILFKQEGINGLKKQILKEAEIINNKDEFFKIYDNKGNIILNTNTLVHTQNIVIDLENYKKLTPDKYEIVSLDDFHIIIYKLSQKYTLAIGKSKYDKNRLLNRLLSIFYNSGIIVFLLSLIGGFLIANSITRKIKKISNTAKELSTSMKLEKRVPISQAGDELDDLAIVINNLLDRIEILIKTLKETTESIAHDLKTPIARIRAASENMLMKNKVSKECSDLLVYTIEETESLNQMIADLLTISKLESGTFQLSMEKINLSKIIKNLYSLFKDYALTKGIKIEMEVDEDIYILGDEKYLSRAIANLLDNAIKFNKEDGKIVIKLKEIEDKVILSISDTGIGIPEDKLDKIFDKFYRADESRGIYMGSGLGLSLVKAVLDRHSAEIKVFSKENEGTTFEITFGKITNL